MDDSFFIKDIEVFYKIVYSSRAKKVRLSIFKDNTLNIIIPKFLKRTDITKLILEKQDWILSTIKENKDNILIEDVENLDKIKSRIKVFLEDRIDYYNSFYNFEFFRISIRRSKTRWGSCSAKKNLNFNYKIFYLPQSLADYIIVHEICHLKEFNHSKSFWKLVGDILPDYKVLKKELKRYSL